MKKVKGFKLKYILTSCMVIFFTITYVLIYAKIQNTQKDTMIEEGITYFSLNCGKVETALEVERRYITMLSGTKIFDAFLNMYITPDERGLYSNYIDFDKGHVNDMISREKDEELREKLNEQMFLSKYTIDVAISRIYDGYTVSQTKTTDIDLYLEKYGITADQINNVFKNRSSEYKNYELFPIANSDGKVLLVYNVKKSVKLGAYIFILLDMRNFINQSENNGNVWAIMKNNSIIVSNHDIPDRAYKKMSGVLQNYVGHSKNIEEDTIYNTNNNYGIFIRPSEAFPGYNYVYFVQHNSNIPLALMINLILLLIVLAAAFYLSNLLYKYVCMPIERLLGLLRINDIPHRRMTSIVNEVENVMLTNKNLKKIIGENTVSLKDKFIIDCARSNVGDSYIREMSNQYNLEKYNHESVCVIFVFQVRNLIEEISNDEWLKIKKTIFKNIKSEFEGEFVDCDFMEFMMITNCKDIQGLAKTISAVLAQMEMEYGINIFASISEIFKGLENFPKAFSQAQYVKFAKPVSENSYCLIYSEVSKRKNSGIRYSVNEEKALIDSIFDNNIEVKRRNLANIVRDNVSDELLGRGEVNDFVFSMAVTIKRILSRMGKTETEVFGEDSIIYLDLKMCETKQELSDKIFNIFERIYDLMDQTDKKRGNKISDEIIAYIDSNYQRDLSLSEICEKFSLSLSYVSRILKECKNVGFKDYITQKRIEKAKEIMQDNPHIKISELSERVGYLNTTTFTRSFKKQEGISPKQYITEL